MTVNDLAASPLATLGTDAFGQTEKARSSTGASSTKQATDQATKRAEQQAEQQQSAASTQVSLSSEGRLRSSVNQLQESSQALTDRRNTDTPEKARAASEKFVNAYNNARNTSNGSTGGEPVADNGGASSSATSTASQLDQTLSDNNNQLSNIGINSNGDGTLSLDQQRLEQAAQNNPQNVSNTLSSVGQQVQSSTSQLNSNTTNNERPNSDQQQAVQQQQNSQQAQQQRAQEQPAVDQLNAINASGAAAYQKVFTL